MELGCTRGRRVIRWCVLLIVLSLSACSGSNEDKAETPQEQMGHEAAEQIKKTLDKAEQASALQEQHNQQIQDAAKPDGE